MIEKIMHCVKIGDLDGLIALWDQASPEDKKTLININNERFNGVLWTTMSGHADIVRMYLSTMMTLGTSEQLFAALTEKNKGMTALIWAANYSQPQIVQELLSTIERLAPGQLLAALNQNNKNGNSALMLPQKMARLK